MPPAPLRQPLTELMDRQPPYDAQAEIDLLGSIVLLPGVLDDVVLILRPDDFHDDAHRKLFEHMCALHEANKKIDPTLLVDRLKSAGDFEAAGGMAYLSKIINAVPNAAHAAYYAEIVKEKSRLRKLIYAATEVLDQAYALLPSEDVAGHLAVAIDAIGQAPTSKALLPLTCRELFRNCPSLRPSIIQGLLREGETMNAIAAPKIGKSWLAINTGLCVVTGKRLFGRFATTPGHVLILDNELHPETIAHRIPKVADALGIGIEEYADALHVKALRGKLRDINGLGQLLLRFKPGQFKLIVVDALYRCLPRGTDENNNADVAQIYNTIDGYAERLQCAFMLVHHSAKGTQAGKATTDIGAGAGSQARATDTHLVLRPTNAEPNIVRMEAATRSWPPLEPLALRWAFPVFEVDENHDPQSLRPERGRKPASGDSTDPRPSKFHNTLDEFERVIRDHGPLTKNRLKDHIPASGTKINEVIKALLEFGRIERCQVQLHNGPHPGFRAVQSAPGQSGLSGLLSGLSDTDGQSASKEDGFVRPGPTGNPERESSPGPGGNARAGH